MNEILTKHSTSSSSSSITVNRIRYNSNNANYLSYGSTHANGGNLKAWCQTNEADYCPVVIGTMSFVILTSMLTIIYLCAKSSFECSWLHCSIWNKLIYPSQRRQRRRRLNGGFALNSSTNYINDSVSLDSINHMNSSASQTAPTSSRARAIWWIYGGHKPVVDGSLSHPNIAAPPSYDESQHLHRIVRPERAQIVRKPKVVNENAAFCLESSLSSETATPATVGAQFPAYRCLTLTATPTHQPRVFQSQHVVDIDSLSMVFDEVPPPYEAVIVGESERRSNPPSTSSSLTSSHQQSFNASLSARLANYSLRSSREFQI
jgi:hypothetical protein